VLYSATTVAALAVTLVVPASAITPLPTPDPKPGTFGVEAVKSKEPPTGNARITTPGNGASFSTSPIDVSGICPTGLLVQVYNNGVMVGAVECEGGSFSVKVSLFAGENELTAEVFDEIGQRGAKSNKVTVNYQDTNLTSFGQLVTLTTNFGRRSAAAGTDLRWPLQLSGGAGPYAFSIDWGDGTPAELKSQATSGVVTINHTFKQAGIYQTNISVTDVNGVSAFLQVIAVSNGEVEASEEEEPAESGPIIKTLWIPAAATSLLLFPAFWLGRRSQMVSLRNKLLHDQEKYDESNPK